MGSGKTSIGKALSDRINWEFIDTDKKIEEIEKKTISDIFQINGEKYFRNIEEVISIKYLKLNNKSINLLNFYFCFWILNEKKLWPNISD